MRTWVVALAFCACGDVNKIDTPVAPDAYQPDSPPVVSCAADEMLCNGATCANPMTDEANCGSCGTQCAPTQGCSAGTCTPIATCAQFKDRDPNAPNGTYRNAAGALLFCDMAGPTQYEQLTFAPYNAGPTGFTLIGAADLQSAIGARAFIDLYNAAGGINAPVSFSTGNCCAAFSSTARVMFGTANVRPGPTGCGGPYAGLLQINLNGSTNVPPPLPADYFTTNAVTEGGICSDSGNPGFFWKKS